MTRIASLPILLIVWLRWDLPNGEAFVLGGGAVACSRIHGFHRTTAAAATTMVLHTKKPPSQPAKKPAFSQAKFSRNNNGKKKEEKKNALPNIYKPETAPPRRADSKIGQLHQERLSTAGRIGTKRYVDPNKLYIGNLSFMVTDDDLCQFIETQLGLPRSMILQQAKIVKHWKTGHSKGYGFLTFSDPVYATQCLEKLHGTMYRDRMLTVKQAQSQKQVAELERIAQEYERKQRQRAQRGNDSPEKEEDMVVYSPEEIAMLKLLDPDLVPDLPEEVMVDDFDDEDDDEVDGVLVEDTDESEEESMNRQQRREAAKRRKKVKRPSKGFGN